MTREELLAKYSDPIRVLDHGFVRLVDVLGDDAAVVQAARCSYGPGTKSVSDDTALIRYLLRHHHVSPFEQCTAKFHMKLPIFVARQMVRHRAANLFEEGSLFDEPNLNEMSGRYSVLPEEFYLPEPGEVRAQSTTNKQGRGAELSTITAVRARDTMRDVSHLAFKAYQELLVEFGVTRELSRIVVPVATYTEWYWSMDLRNLLSFLLLRLDPHAQEETRAFARAMATIVAEWVPTSWGAFEDYMLNAVTFSAPELRVLSELVTRSWNSNFDLGQWLKDKAVEVGLGKRELKEFAQKVHFRVRPILNDEHELLR